MNNCRLFRTYNVPIFRTYLFTAVLDMSIVVSETSPANSPAGIPDAGNPANRYNVLRLVIPEKADDEMEAMLPAIIVISVKPVKAEKALSPITMSLQSETKTKQI